MLALNGASIGLNFADKPEKMPGCQTLILESSDVPIEAQRLESDGVEFQQTLIDKGFGPTFTIYDPDKNKIEVVQQSETQ